MPIRGNGCQPAGSTTRRLPGAGPSSRDTRAAKRTRFGISSSDPALASAEDALASCAPGVPSATASSSSSSEADEEDEDTPASPLERRAEELARDGSDEASGTTDGRPLPRVRLPAQREKLSRCRLGARRGSVVCRTRPVPMRGEDVSDILSSLLEFGAKAPPADASWDQQYFHPDCGIFMFALKDEVFAKLRDVFHIECEARKPHHREEERVRDVKAVQAQVWKKFSDERSSFQARLSGRLLALAQEQGDQFLVDKLHADTTTIPMVPVDEADRHHGFVDPESGGMESIAHLKGPFLQVPPHLDVAEVAGIDIVSELRHIFSRLRAPVRLGASNVKASARADRTVNKMFGAGWRRHSVIAENYQLFRLSKYYEQRRRRIANRLLDDVFVSCTSPAIDDAEGMGTLVLGSELLLALHVLAGALTLPDPALRPNDNGFLEVGVDRSQVLVTSYLVAELLGFQGAEKHGAVFVRSLRQRLAKAAATLRQEDLQDIATFVDEYALQDGDDDGPEAGDYEGFESRGYDVQLAAEKEELTALMLL